MKKTVFALGLATLLLLAASAAGKTAYAEAAPAQEPYHAEYTVVERAGAAPRAAAAGYEDWLFAGWYKTADCEPIDQAIKKSEIGSWVGRQAYAKYVSPELLNVKFQVLADVRESAQTNLRMVSTVDTLNYAAVGFRVAFHSDSGTTRTAELSGSKVYRRIVAGEESGVPFAYNPKVFAPESAYFITATVTDIQSVSYDNTFVVTPYWITLDGARVEGVTRYTQVQDAYTDRATPLAVKAADQSYVDSLTVEGYDVVERRYDPGEAYATLILDRSKRTAPSLAVYSVCSGGEVVASAAYRNPASRLGAAEDQLPAGDRTWYLAQPDRAAYVLVTPADLYGFAELLNTGVQSFAGRTVYLACDVAVDGSAYRWQPAGTASRAFSGVFDGQGQTVSGLRAEGTNFVGFFGVAAQGSTVRCLRLTDSSFTGAMMVGSVAGRGQGSVERVYSSAAVTSSQGYAGGIVGQSLELNNAPADVHLSECWFDGTLSVTGDGFSYAGGILGENRNNHVMVTNCLNTGSIVTASTRDNPIVGGIVGCVTNEGAAATVTDCLNTGTITADESGAKGLIGSLIGKTADNRSAAVNSYATRESWPSATTCIAGKSTAGQLPARNLLGAKGYANTQLDFNNYWAAVADGTPQLKAFAAGETLSPAGNRVDTSWYDPAGQTFVLTTREQFLGFAQLTHQYDFSGQTVRLGADITLNQGDAADWETQEPEEQWLAMSPAAVPFAGTFDGQGHTISGLYAKSDEPYLGLFGKVAAAGTVENLRLVNSRVEQTGAGSTGGVVCELRGTLRNVYSAAAVATSGNQTGGLVGRAGTDGSGLIRDAWFDGTLQLRGSALYGGGIVGLLYEGSYTLQNCLFTGTVESQRTVGGAAAGGVCGAAISGGAVLDSCVSTGTLRTANHDLSAGALVGWLSGDAEALSMTNVFAARSAGFGEVGTNGGAAVTGQAVWVGSADRLIGYCREDLNDNSAEQYPGAELDFDTEWILRRQGAPVPAAFSDLAGAVTPEGLDREIGLDRWLSFDSTAHAANAVHYGAGQYVLRFGGEKDSKSAYTAYIDHLKGTLGFTERQANVTDALCSGIYTKTDGDWVLNVLHLGDTGETVITVRTGIDRVLSPALSPAASGAAAGNVTLSMLSLRGSPAMGSEQYGGEGTLLYYGGQDFIFRLPNGHFIVNDGGSDSDFEALLSYLKLQADLYGNGQVRIDAWTVSHQHLDHFGVAAGFYAKPSLAEGVTVEAVYLNEPNNRAADFTPPADDALYSKNSRWMNLMHRGVRSMRTASGEPTPVYSYQTGEVYRFNGLTMRVIQSQELIPVSDYAQLNEGWGIGTDFNTVSTVLLFTTDHGQKVLIGGDATHKNMEYIMGAYGSDPATLDGIDVFQSFHHGKNMSYTFRASASDAERRVFVDYLTDGGTKPFSVVLFPCSKLYGIDSNTDFGVVYKYSGICNRYMIEDCLAPGGGYYTFNEAEEADVVLVTFAADAIRHGRYTMDELNRTGGLSGGGNPDEEIEGPWG